MEDTGIGSAVQQIVNLTAKSMTSEIMEAPGEPAGTYYITRPGMPPERIVSGPAWHNETLNTPRDLCEFIKKVTLDDSGDTSALFISPKSVVYVYSLDDRRHRASVALKTSPQFDLLSASPPQMTQKDFVRMLRITLHGCLMSENLLPLVRDLKFNAASDGGGDIQHGRESIGRSVTAAVTGVAAIPEEIGVNIPVFENHSFRAKIMCAIEIFPQEGTFKLTPYPLEVKSAMDAAIDDIDEILEAAPTRVFRGNP